MPEPASLGESLLGIVDHPARTLANVVAYPRWRWVAPALLAIVSLAILLAVSAPLLAAQSQQVMAQQLSRMSSSQAEAVQRQMATFQNPAFVAGIAFATGLIALAVGWLIQGAILYFSDLIAGGELEFRQLLAAVPWLAVPFSLENLLQAAWVGTQHKLLVNNGLSYLVSSGKASEDARNLAYVGLSQVSLFRLWHLVLVYVLFRGAARFKPATSFWLTVAYLIVLVGGQLAIAAIGRMLSPG